MYVLLYLEIIYMYVHSLHDLLDYKIDQRHMNQIEIILSFILFELFLYQSSLQIKLQSHTLISFLCNCNTVFCRSVHNTVFSTLEFLYLTIFCNPSLHTIPARYSVILFSNSTNFDLVCSSNDIIIGFCSCSWSVSSWIFQLLFTLINSSFPFSTWTWSN